MICCIKASHHKAPAIFASIHFCSQPFYGQSSASSLLLPAFGDQPFSSSLLRPALCFQPSEASCFHTLYNLLVRSMSQAHTGPRTR